MGSGKYWAERCPGKRALEDMFQAAQERQRENFFEKSSPQIGNRDLVLDGKPFLFQQFFDTSWVKIKVQFDEFTCSRVERVPILPAEPVAQDGFDVAFIGKFEDERQIRQQEPH